MIRAGHPPGFTGSRTRSRRKRPMRNSVRVRSALVLACTVVPVVAAGQSVRPLFGAGIGRSIPNGAYHSDGNANGEGFEPGWAGTLLVGVKLPRTPVVIRVAANYSDNGANEQLKADLTTSTGQPTDAKMHLLGALVDVGYEFGTSFRRFFLFGGGGPYRVRLSVSSGGLSADTTETKFAWSVGGGLTWDLTHTDAGLFLEGRYRSEEHTSELQSRLHLVRRLPLEK